MRIPSKNDFVERKLISLEIKIIKINKKIANDVNILLELQISMSFSKKSYLKQKECVENERNVPCECSKIVLCCGCEEM